MPSLLNRNPLSNSGQGLTEVAIFILMLSSITIAFSKCGGSSSGKLTLETPGIGANGFPILDPALAKQCCYANGNARVNPIPENCPRPLSDGIRQAIESGVGHVRLAADLLKQAAELKSDIPEVAISPIPKIR